MEHWQRIADFPLRERNKLLWQLRHHAAAMVEAGAAMKYGREWYIHTERLPEYLRQQTLEALGRDDAGR